VHLFAVVELFLTFVFEFEHKFALPILFHVDVPLDTINQTFFLASIWVSAILIQLEFFLLSFNNDEFIIKLFTADF